MRLLSLRFRHVGPFGDKGVSLDGLQPGLNVVCETNEFGKSTVLKALETVLFKPFSSADKNIKSLLSSGSDEGPEGEIAFESGGQSYRLTKRFLKRKLCELRDASGTVIATDREAEERLAILLGAQGYEKGPSGLLWVRQGSSMDRVVDDGQVASRLEGELGALVGGDRAREYLARVETELSENITPRSGREKSNGPLKLARDRLEQISAELETAKAQRHATREIGKALAATRDKLKRLETEADPEEIHKQIQTTRAEMNEASIFESRLQTLQSECDRAREKAVRAAERQAAYNEARAQFDRWTENLAGLEHDHAREAENLKALQDEKTELLHHSKTLAQQLAEFTEARKSNEHTTRLKFELEEVSREAAFQNGRLEEYETLAAQLQSLDEQLGDLPQVNRADVEPLRRLEARGHQADTEIAALTTRLYLSLDKNASGRVEINGQPLTSGAFELSGGDVLKIEGIGSLRSDDTRLRDLKSEQAESREAFQARLEALGVETVAEAAQAANIRHDLEADQKRITADMMKLAPQGLGALQAACIKSQDAAQTLSDRLNALVDTVDQDFDANRETKTPDELNQARGRLDAVEARFSACLVSRATLKGQIDSLTDRRAALRLAETEAARLVEADRLAGERLAADSQARLSEKAIEDARAAAPKHAVDFLKSRLARLETITSQMRDQIETLKRQEISLQTQRDAAFEGEDVEARLGALTQAREAQAREVARIERQIAAQILLRDTLKASQSRLQSAYTEPVRAELAPLLAMVIPGAEASLGESLGANTVGRNGQVEDIEQLSGGTQEQIAILTRLAYARLLKRGGADAPVILDDALVYADDRRRDDMFEVLNYVTSGDDGLQLLYLSCHMGATQRLGGHRVTVGEWSES